MIVGYGFGDKHINSVIAEVVEHHRLKVFILNINPSLKNHLLSVPYGTVIWRGLISTVTRGMTEVFPSNQAETGEYIRVKNTFFV